MPRPLGYQQGRFHKGFINPKPESTPLILGDRLSPQGLYRDSCIIKGSNVTCSTTTVEARKLQHDKLITLRYKVYRIPAPIILNPCSNFLGFTVLRGSWDLVSKVISTLIRVISRYKYIYIYSYLHYNPSY